MTKILSSNNEKHEIDHLCIKCGRDIALHPASGRFKTVILYGRECAWNPDKEFRDFVINTLRTSGYNLEDFNYFDDSGLSKS